MDGLSGFDTTTMTYLATQMAQPNVGDNGEDMLLPLELQDYQSTFGYAGSDEPNLPSLQPQPTPQIKRFSSTYEDPFSDIVSHFDTAQNEPETPSIERDNKLLSFSLPTFDFTLLDWSNRQTTISLSAQLHGMFFLAESPWAAAGESRVAPPSELTCYRRNLFQITGEITLSRAIRFVMTEQGEHIPIIGQEIILSATESTEGNHVKIISVPWKTPANPGMPVVDDKVEREPPSIPLDMMNVQEVGTDFATFPFQWKRLQFRIATANNGRRKELQQHFVVHLRVIATLATGAKIPVCEVHSGAIIVRGRSPRNFQSRKDMPLNGSGAMTTVPPQTSPFEGAHMYAITSPDLRKPSSKPPPPPAAPINLSLVEDDSPIAGKSVTPEHRGKKLHVRARAPSFGLITINSPDESADLLYEYFPLGLDDWMPPVDAVYRPHVVHHTKLLSDPRDPKTTGKSARSKRLYASDDVT
ncbi:p53-like transcription factor [Teratosphaeria nubilosa]|uniref:p53-like transcription factor n=1 Tax=Teratosphaeria nubilosa TaxID=161662 RepID=A0A6G1L424_9PEZI|nr:p53-like transcription factor [Teratosphaeria nubilosa]